MKTILTIFAWGVLFLGAVMLLTLLPPVVSVLSMLFLLVVIYFVIKTIVGAIS